MRVEMKATLERGGDGVSCEVFFFFFPLFLLAALLSFLFSLHMCMEVVSCDAQGVKRKGEGNYKWKGRMPSLQKDHSLYQHTPHYQRVTADVLA